MSDLQLGCGLLQGGEAAGDLFGGLAGGGGRGGVGSGGFEVLIFSEGLAVGGASERGSGVAVLFGEGEHGGGAGGQGFADVGIDGFEVGGEEEEGVVESAGGDGEEEAVGDVRSDLADKGEALFGAAVFEAQNEWFHAGDEVLTFHVFEAAEDAVPFAGCKQGKIH
jgi:hypothetical protein